MFKSFICGLAAIAIVAGSAMSGGNTVSFKNGQDTFANFLMHNFLNFKAQDND